MVIKQLEESHKKLVEAEKDMEYYLHSTITLTLGFVLGIFASIIATIAWEEILRTLPDKMRWTIELIIIILFLVVWMGFYKRHKKGLEIINELKNLREGVEKMGYPNK